MVTMVPKNRLVLCASNTHYNPIIRFCYPPESIVKTIYDLIYIFTSRKIALMYRGVFYESVDVIRQLKHYSFAAAAIFRLKSGICQNMQHDSILCIKSLVRLYRQNDSPV
jgi:hypothetical protein